MQAFVVDRLLLHNAPSWYRSPEAQTAMLGLIFFWVFAAYTTMQFYSMSIYGPKLASSVVSSTYLTFAMTCLISPTLRQGRGGRGKGGEGGGTLLFISARRDGMDRRPNDDNNDEGADIEMITDERSSLAIHGRDRTNTIQGRRRRPAKGGIVMAVGDDLSQETWAREAMGTLRLFLTNEMMCLSPLFFYTGFNQPYQQATYGNRFFTRRTIGAELIVFHLMEIVGAVIVGRFLDKGRYVASTRRTRAIMCLGSFVVINCAGNIFAAAQEYAAKENDGNPIAHDISDVSVVSPSLAFACWGFADAQIQVFCYWLMGGLYTSGSDHSRAVGFYKLVQSLGTSIGFYLIPTSRLSESSQLAWSSLVFFLGTALSFSQLPSA
ncbi:hypothetical protein ACHAXA_001369 [Cyclostephanos tholiformis]|uniref:Uncharacterized protein n=1 Tax=Cyclostephanos tholiformis TaxID=382380 RepID=A0ABD3REF5_9STRA